MCCTGIPRCAAQVVGVPDGRLGEVGAAFVTLNEWISDRGRTDRWCQASDAPTSACPVTSGRRTFEPIGMTASGKVQKVKLRDTPSNEYSLGTAHAHSPVSPAGLDPRVHRFARDFSRRG